MNHPLLSHHDLYKLHFFNILSFCVVIVVKEAMIQEQELGNKENSQGKREREREKKQRKVEEKDIIEK